jgi:hypothetical protein
MPIKVGFGFTADSLLRAKALSQDWEKSGHMVAPKIQDLPYLYGI